MEMTIDKSTASNAQNSVTFKTTENSAKIFSMLAQFLYSDRELAVLHELSSNAVDAHKMVGKEDVPIEVHLPTQLSPNLIIRDFGPGLHHDDVIKFLTTYGESNKAESNDFIGGYGIGSKSPAAVSDTWQILSKHGGVANQYLVAINNQGIPSLTKLRESSTDESGLEVIVPVNPSQIRLWATAGNNAFQYYKVPPIVKGLAGQTQPKVQEYAKDHSLFKIEPNGLSYSPKCKVLSGIRAYTVDMVQILPSLKKEFVSVIGGVSSRSFLLPFNIGDLDLDLSREKLRYTSHTIKTIADRIHAVGNVIKKEITDALSGLQRIEYTGKAAEFHKLYSEFLFKVIEGNEYGIQSVYQLNTIEFPNNIVEGQYKVGFNGKIAALTLKYTCGGTHSVSMNRNYKDKSARVCIRLSVYDRVVFVLDDDKTVATRVRNSSVKDNKIYVIGSEFNSLDPYIQSIAIKGSSLPAVPPTTRGPKKAAIKTDLYKRSGNRFLRVLEADILRNACLGVVYVCTEITSATSILSDVYAKETEFVSNFIEVKVIAVKKGKTIPVWAKHVKDARAELVAKYEKEVQNYHDNCKLRVIKATPLVSCFILNKDNLPDSELKSFFISVDSVRGGDEGISALGHARRGKLGQVLPDLTVPKYSNTITDINDKLEKMKQKYPMLNILCDHSYHRVPLVFDSVVEYVNLVEKAI